MPDDLKFITRNGTVYTLDSESAIVHPVGMLPPSASPLEPVPSIGRVAPELVEHQIRAHGLGDLIIEVTTGCNLRCKYCVFSGSYPHQRTHLTDSMSVSDARRAVTLYLNLFNESRSFNPERIPTIAFYGGEPLLNVAAIRAAIDQAEELSVVPPTFLVTTNATLLSDNVIDLFIAHNVLPAFSIDGDEIQHDRNRVTRSGRGTHAKVMRRVDEFVERSGRPAFVISTLDLRTDLHSLMEFFVREPHLLPLFLNPVNSFDTTFYQKFKQEDFERNRAQMRELEALFIILLEKPELTDEQSRQLQFLHALVGRRCAMAFSRTIYRQSTPQLIPFTGQCIPGDKIFVATTGEFYSCERIERTRPIGNLKEGLRFDWIADLVNEINDSVTAGCSSCSLRNVCSLCLQSFSSGGKLSANRRHCAATREMYTDLLATAYEISESVPTWAESYTTTYYQKIRDFTLRCS